MFNFKKKKENLPENMKDVLSELKELRKENKEIKKEIEDIKKEQENFLHEVEMVRFNPFQEKGGDQSFSVAFLNKKGNGAVFTGLYTKEGSRVYGKPIKKGESKYSLSKEEESIIGKALGVKQRERGKIKKKKNEK